MAAPKKTDKPAKSSSKPSETRTKAIHAVSAILTLVGLYYAYDRFAVPFFRWNNLHLHSMQDRLVFALRLQVLPLLTILIAIFNISRMRFRNPGAKNPLSGNEHLIQVSLKIANNTIEQFLLHLGNQLILATYLPEDKLRLLPLLAIYFFLGRITFLIGYSMNHNYRAYGFLLTFIPTFGAIGYNIYFMATLGLTSRLSAPSIRG